MERSAAPSAVGRRVYHLLLGDRVIGLLGNIPGQYESAHGGSEPGPPSCAYRSYDAASEGSVLELLHASADFETVADILHRAGLRLEETDEAHRLRPSAVLFRAVVASPGHEGEWAF